MSRKSSAVKRNTSATEFDYSLKCILIGDSGVGKTCLMQTLQGLKNPMKTTPSVDGVFHRRVFKASNSTLQFSIWDTAGTEAFKSVTRIFYRGASCALVVFDITNRTTFRNVENWVKDLREYSTNSKPALVLVGNKSDKKKERQVVYDEAERYAKSNAMTYIETSALNGDNIELAFETAAQQLYDKIKIGSIVPNPEINGIKLGSSSTHSTDSNLADDPKKGCGC